MLKVMDYYSKIRNREVRIVLIIRKNIDYKLIVELTNIIRNEFSVWIVSTYENSCLEYLGYVYEVEIR
jgi:hypothetical protein